MKVMVMVKATQGSEEGKLPSPELMAAMGAFNEALVAAGIMQAGDGLKPTKEGYRVRFDGSDRIVTKGPFAETNELVAGYWVWEVSSVEDAIDWVKKCPNPMEEEISEIEIRPYFEMADFAEVDEGGEFAKKEEALRGKVALQRAKVKNYLFFGGRCEEALNFYQENLGANIEMLLRFDQAPDPIPEGVLQPGFEQKVMHGVFHLGDATFFASDGCGDVGTHNGFSLALQLDEPSTVESVFAALAKDGEILMPLEPTFFSPLYGQVRDKFGIAWMVMIAGE